MVSDISEVLARRVIARATQDGMRIAAAESLTGGLLASSLVSVPGASRAFSGGIVAYDTELKHSLLGVDRSLLRDRGPVDGDVARQMALGVRRACGREAHGRLLPADYGVATTGVAGPDPDAQTGQPAGTVWIAVSSTRGEREQLFESLGATRAEVREGALVAALQLLLEELQAG